MYQIHIIMKRIPFYDHSESLQSLLTIRRAILCTAFLFEKCQTICYTFFALFFILLYMRGGIMGSLLEEEKVDTKKHIITCPLCQARIAHNQEPLKGCRDFGDWEKTFTTVKADIEYELGDIVLESETLELPASIYMKPRTFIWKLVWICLRFFYVGEMRERMYAKVYKFFTKTSCYTYVDEMEGWQELGLRFEALEEESCEQQDDHFVSIDEVLIVFKGLKEEENWISLDTEMDSQQALDAFDPEKTHESSTDELTSCPDLEDTK